MGRERCWESDPDETESSALRASISAFALASSALRLSISESFSVDLLMLHLHP